MTKRIYTLLALMFCAVFAFAQNTSDLPSYDGSDFQETEEATEMTSERYFPEKPRHGTEIGLSVGHFFVHGDVYAMPSWGVGLHLRRAINYTVSWRLSAVYGRPFSLDDRFARFGYGGLNSQGSGIQLPRGGVNGYETMGYNFNDLMYRNVKSHMGWGSLHFIVNASNILFHKKNNKWNLYLFGGPSMLFYKSHINLLDENDEVYRRIDNNATGMYADPGTITNRDEFFWRKRIKAIRNYLDDSWETPVLYGNGETDGLDTRVPGYQDYNLLGRANFALMPALDWGIGVSRKITKRINLAVEHQSMISLNDDLEGYVQGVNVDVPHYTNLKLNVNLMGKNAIEPLYWVNPLDFTMQKLAELDGRKIELEDADGDGVVDQFDDEPDTREGCPVDTRGRALDSDGDGVLDCDDEQPYTPYDLVSEVDDKGVANPEPVKVCEDCLTREDIKNVGREQGWYDKPAPVSNECSNWFLPMIHFDLNKYALKPEAKAQLHHIAQVLKNCPNMCISAVGHTDKLNNNAYNQTLSYNRAKAAADYLTQVYGISPSRISVSYGGEETPIDSTEKSSYINRRVEFKVTTCGTPSMGSPAGGSGFGSGNAPVKY